MTRLSTTITILAILFIISNNALAGGGTDLTGHPLIDIIKGKQESLASAIVPSSGAVVVTGYQNLIGNANDDIYTIKYAADGSLIWRAVYDSTGGSDQGTAVAIDKSGDAIIAGSVTNGTNYDIYVARYHDNGTATTPTVIWSKTWSGTPSRTDLPLAIAYDTVNDRVYVTGYANNGTNDDYLLLAFDNTGTGDNTPLWTKTYNAGGTDRAYALAVSADGSKIAVTGESSNGATLDLVTVLWDSAGNQLRTWSKSAATSYNGRGTAVSFTPAGNLVVAGYLNNSRGGDLYTAELSPGSGTPLWEASYDAGFDDQPAALAIDSLGDVYVAATIGPLPAFSKIFLIKYHNKGTATPDTVWSSTYDAGSINASGAVALALDPLGGAFVTGWRDYSGVRKVVTIKYSRSSGRLLWDKEWGGIPGNSSRPVGLGLAGQGVVTAAWSDRTQPLDSGTATGGTNLSLEDTGKTWTTSPYATDFWAGYSVYMVSGLNKDNFRRIRGNGATTLTLATGQDFPAPVSNGDLYYLYDRDDIDFVVLRHEKGILDPPTGLSAQAISNTSVKLTFQDNTTSETGFKIDVKIGESGSWNIDAYTISTPDQTGTGTVTQTITGLASDSDYFFRVKAYDGSGSGDVSTETHALTKIITFSTPSLSYTYADPYGGNDQAVAAACYSGGYPVFFGSIFADLNSTGDPSFDLYTAKLSRSDFSVQWYDKREGGYYADDLAVAMAVDANRETVITSTSNQSVAGVGTISSIWTLKYPFAPTSDGFGEAEATWTNQLNGTGKLSDHADAVAVQGVSPYAVAIAGHGNADFSNIDFYVRKLSATGAEVFTAERHLGGKEYPAAVALDSAGNVFVAGRVDIAGNNDWFVAKLDAVSGVTVWSDIFGGTGDDRALALTLDSAGNLYVAGYSTHVPSGFTRMTLIKYWGNAPGPIASRLWEGETRTYPSEPLTGNSAIRKIRYDAYANEIVVAGDINYGTNDRDMAVLRYNTAGNLLWESELRRSGSDETLTDLAIDPSGYIYLVGDSGTSPNTDIVSAIYTPSGSYDKSFLYNGSSGKDDHAAAIATNQFGEAFVAGYTTNSANNKDFLALKLVNDLVIMPTGLTTAPQTDPTKMNLSWTNVTSGTTLYLSRSVQGSGIWVSPAGTTGGKLPVDSATFADSGLTANTPYCWRLYAELNTVTTRFAETCNSTTLVKPAAPTATDATGSPTALRISWSNQAGNTGYLLERKTGVSGNYAAVVTTSANATGYDDTGLSPSTAYYYRLSVQSASGWSQTSTDSAVAYTAPTLSNWGWSGTSVPDATHAGMSWYYPGSDFSGIRVQRKTASSPWADVGTAGRVFSYTDSGLTPNTAYTYRIFFNYNGSENSTPSPELTLTTPLDPPNLLSASALSASSITATWTQVSGNTGYLLSARDCSFYPIATLSANPNLYCNYGKSNTIATDTITGTTSASTGVRAWYTVVLTKKDSTYSAASNGILVFAPLSVNLTNVDITASNQLKPIWSNTLEDNFDVQRRIPPSTTWTTVKSGLAADTLNWLDTTVTNGTQYCYRIRAYTAAGGPADAYSTELCQTAQAPPASPSLALSTPTPTTIKFDWNNTNYPTSMNYDVYVSTYSFGSGGTPETFPSYWDSNWSKLTTVSCPTASCSYTYTPRRGDAVRSFVRTNFYGTVIDSQTISPAAGYVQAVPPPPSLMSTAATTSTITFSWYRSEPAYGYNVYNKLASDSFWSGPTSVARSWDPSSLTISSLTDSTKYQVRIEAVGKTWESSDAPIITIWTKPLTPSITGISDVTASQAKVCWTSVSRVTGYKLERSTDNTNWSLVTNQNVTCYTNTGLTAGTTYWYRVKAVNEGWDSSPSAAVQAVMVPPTPEDPMPRQISDTELELSFSTVKGASSYKIYRRDGSPAAAQYHVKTADVAYGEDYCGNSYPSLGCATAIPRKAVVMDSGLSANTTYCYSLVALNANGESPMGQELCGQTSAMGAPAVTVIPQNPFVTKVSWTPGAAALTIDGHTVEVVENDGTIREIARVPMPSLAFFDKSALAPGTKRTYRVRPYRRFSDDFSTGLNLTDWAPWGRHRHGDGNEDFTTPPVNATDIDGTVRVSWDPSGKAELYSKVPGGITVNSYNFAQIGLNRLDLFTGDFDINFDFTVDKPVTIPDTTAPYNVYARIRIYYPNSASGSLRNDIGFGYNNTSSGPYFDIFTFLRGVNASSGPWFTGDKLQQNSMKASRRGKKMYFYRKDNNNWSLVNAIQETSTMTPQYVWLVNFDNRTNPTETEIRTLVDNVEAISYGTPSAQTTVEMPSFDPGTNYCP